MAIFETPSQLKPILDDTETLICTVENSQNINRHTEYILRMQRGPAKDNQWHVSRRYRDFSALHTSLQCSGIDLPLPPKKLIGNMQPFFIAERQIALQTYINEILNHQILALSLQVRWFLDPKNYSMTVEEQALQTVSIALRGDGRYELKGPLTNIGWRIRKHYFLVTDVESRTNCILSWQKYGTDRYLNDKDLQAAFKSLQNISHLYVDEILALHNLDTGAYAVRRIHEKGSIRDMIYGTEYSRSYLSKYGNPKIRRPFTMGQMVHYGYQILLALKFLHDKGVPHGHIHTGNIAIVQQRAVLLDIEGALIGGAAPCRAQLRQRRRPANTAYCFGLALYEMAFARPLQQPCCDAFPGDIPASLESVLRLCLSSETSRHGGPSLEDLLSHPAFAAAPAPALTAHLKLLLHIKDALREAAEKTEARLREEQKLVRRTRREVRIKEILNSEEELKKHKRRARKRESIWKSTSSLAETIHSHSASTASSPTPPTLSGDNVPHMNGASVSPVMTPGAVAASCSGSVPANGRSELLSAICSFDRSRLARVQAR